MVRSPPPLSLTGVLPVRAQHSKRPSHDPEDFKTLPEAEVNQLKEEARNVLHNDTLHYKNKSTEGLNNSQNDWLQTMMNKGTFQDKIAASVLLIQNSPIHGLGIIRGIVNRMDNAKECIKVMGVLTDLFMSDLLVPNKKLRPFEKRPLSLLEKLSDGALSKRKFYLSLWYFEDQLKNEYMKFVQAIAKVGRDAVEKNRINSIHVMQKLLTANPEQEVLLLSNLVNKIGDPKGAVASTAIHCLGKVLEEHPNMKTVIMEEIEKLLFRSNVSEKARFYSLCFLSQYVLKKDEENLANRLIEIYFSFFKASIKQGDVDKKLMSTLLVGVKRAFPFANKDSLKLKEHTETMYKIVHIANFNVAIHALYLLFQVSDLDAAISDRFYSVLYRKILDPDLCNTSLQALFISLVFRAMSKDIETKRIKTFIKRLLQICHYVPVPLACGILVMISQLLNNNKSLECLSLIKTKFDEDEEGGEEELYKDVKLEDMEEHEEDPSDGSSPLKNETDNLPENRVDEKPVISSWHHIVNAKEASLNDFKKNHCVHARNPLFLNSELSVYTELVSLATHFHPTVSLFANHLIEGRKIKQSGDPLKDYSLQNFLDRWVFKNPKKLAENKEPSKFSREGRYSSRVKTLAVTSEEYLNLHESLVPPEELFLYRYLKKKEEGGKKVLEKTKDEDDDDDDISSVASDEFEGMMDRLMGGQESIDYAEGINKLSSESEKSNKRKTKGDIDEDDDDFDDDNDNDDDENDFDEDEFDDMSDCDDEASDVKGEDETDDYSDIKEEFSDLDELDDDDEAITFDGGSEDDFAFTMSDVEQDELEHKQRKKNKKSNYEGKIMKKKGYDGSVFAPVEEFAEMLEETGDEYSRFGSLANVSNKDKAGMKQLKWEENRNQWIHGHRGKRKRGGGKQQSVKKFKKR
ncbi:Uncharacterized protein GBIM_09855 [Gryllus bimaculatus]|nr:Uncharacterized protein GBIM_09855 [Gryllus bimaculatus]